MNTDRLQSDLDRLEERAGEHQVSLAVLSAQILALNKTIEALEHSVQGLCADQKEIRAQLSTGRGILVGVAFVLGSLASWALNKFIV